jgi:type IV secretory pathway VirB3-like protein
MLAGLPPEWAMALGALWWAVYIVSANLFGCAFGAIVCWLTLALVLHHDPHSIEVLRRALQHRNLLEG